MCLSKMDRKNYEHLIQAILGTKIILKMMLHRNFSISASEQIFRQD